MLIAEAALSELTLAWTHDDPPESRLTSVLDCSVCASSDLIDMSQRVGNPHRVLHSLLAPIEEVIDDAVQRFAGGTVPALMRASRLSRVDGYRADLRSRARGMVAAALGGEIARLAAD